LNQEVCALQNLLESYRQSFVKRQAEIDELQAQVQRLIRERAEFAEDVDRLRKKLWPSRTTCMCRRGGRGNSGPSCVRYGVSSIVSMGNPTPPRR